MCIFEADPQRSGGRAFLYQDELLGDSVLDIGAYRFRQQHSYVWGIVQNVFNNSGLLR